MTNMGAQVYRHYDADGTLLYVGSSLLALARLAKHVTKSHWARQIVRVEIEWFDSAAEAAIAEMEAIITERPRHNKVVSGYNGAQVGRPRLEDRDKTLKKLKPWVALGMSRSTWYARQAELRAREKQ